MFLLNHVIIVIAKVLLINHVFIIITNVLLLNHVIFVITKVFLPQIYVTVTDFSYLFFDPLVFWHPRIIGIFDIHVF